MNQARDDFWDDDFHGCALVAFAEEARAVQGWPESEKVRLRAYALYEGRKRADA